MIDSNEETKKEGQDASSTPVHKLDFSKLQKLTIDDVKGRLSPIETSEFNNLLGQVTGELNTAQSPDEIEHFKQRIEVLYNKLNG